VFLISSSKTDADRPDKPDDFWEVEEREIMKGLKRNKAKYKREGCMNVSSARLNPYCIDNHFHYQYYYGVNAKYIFRLKF